MSLQPDATFRLQILKVVVKSSQDIGLWLGTIWGALAFAERAIGSMVKDAACGMVVARGDDAGFASAILQLRIDRALRDAMGRRARRLLDDRLSRSKALRLWQNLIGELSPPP